MLYLAEQALFRTKRHIASQVNRAVFCLLMKAKALLLPIVIQIEMFLKTVKPILLYACEIYGNGNVDILEQVQLKFLKSILNLKNIHLKTLYMLKQGFCPLKFPWETDFKYAIDLLLYPFQMY